MARRTPKHQRLVRPLSGSHATTATKRDGRWVVRTVPGASAVKDYTCPACHRTIGMGTAHVVAWPETPSWGVERASDARRHWHTSCWERRV